jgi:hypothetical protein
MGGSVRRWDDLWGPVDRLTEPTESTFHLTVLDLCTGGPYFEHRAVSQHSPRARRCRTAAAAHAPGGQGGHPLPTVG